MSRRRANRNRALAFGAFAVVALSLVGCDLMVVQVTPSPSRLSRTPEPFPTDDADATNEIPTPEASTSESGPGIQNAANALADLRSYRVGLVSTGLVPATTADGTVTMSSTLVQGGDPRAEFTMVGVDGLTGGRLEAVVIGDEAWQKEGAGSWAKSPGGAADFDSAFTALSPIDLASGFDGLSPMIRLVRTEQRNGIEARRYQATAADPAVAAAGLSAGSADVWIATRGGYLVALDVDGTWDVDGTPTPITLRIDVSHVDDPANVIRAPI